MGVGSPRGLAGLAPVSGSAWSKVVVATHPAVSGWAGTRVSGRIYASSTSALPLRFSARGLPSGIAVGASSGTITGIPRNTGTFHVTATVRDASGASATTTFSWTVRRHRVVPSASPRVVGTVARGHKVRAYVGTWRRDSAHGARVHPSAVHVRWYRDGHAIRGATHSTFTIPWSWSYHGHRLSFRVTAAVPYYTGYARTSPRTKRIA
jgi:hypothetical protein